MSKIRNALLVMVTDKRIRAYLETHDPKAFEQAVRALETPTEQESQQSTAHGLELAQAATNHFRRLHHETWDLVRQAPDGPEKAALERVAGKFEQKIFAAQAVASQLQSQPGITLPNKVSPFGWEYGPEPESDVEPGSEWDQPLPGLYGPGATGTLQGTVVPDPHSDDLYRPCPSCSCWTILGDEDCSNCGWDGCCTASDREDDYDGMAYTPEEDSWDDPMDSDECAYCGQNQDVDRGLDCMACGILNGPAGLVADKVEVQNQNTDYQDKLVELADSYRERANRLDNAFTAKDVETCQRALDEIVLDFRAIAREGKAFRNPKE